jgi:hypothetical protein
MGQGSPSGLWPERIILQRRLSQIFLRRIFSRDFQKFGFLSSNISPKPLIPHPKIICANDGEFVEIFSVKFAANSPESKLSNFVETTRAKAQQCRSHR